MGAYWSSARAPRGAGVLETGPPLIVAVSVAALVYAGVRELPRAVVALAAVSALAMVALILVQRRVSAQAEPDTDPVTGLGTHDALVADLDRRLGAEPSPTLMLLFDLHGFKAYNDDFGHGAGNVLLVRLAEKLRKVAGPDGAVFRASGDEFWLVAPVAEGDAEDLIERASAALAEKGEGFRIDSSFGGVLLPYEATDARTALRLAEERLAGHRRMKQGARAMSALAEALAVGGQGAPLSGRVESLAVAVGGLLGVHGDRLQELARAAELHDLGKLSIPGEILDKPGPLDQKEWEFVRQQTLVAEHVVRTSPQLRGVAPIVRATYENFDGSGYPDGRAGEDIPLPARIIRVCQAFDAMLSPRSYRPALTPEEALAELEARAGSSFDPAVVRVLAALVTARAEERRAA
ncbi:MAG TPA: HD domain-containing phosphohydrolase [Gaiellaceae bacterium]|nr:HD domain-containing phosphohydrolase [Gaiellaceae bacterium]